MLKERLKRLEEAFSTGRMVILDVSYSKDGGKYYETASNGTAWIKREIDPHKKLFEGNEGVIVEQYGIDDGDMMIEIVGVSRMDDQDVIYKETYEGRTKALLKDGIAY